MASWLLRLAGAAPPLRRLLCDELCRPLPPPPPLPPLLLPQSEPAAQAKPDTQQQQKQKQQHHAGGLDAREGKAAGAEGAGTALGGGSSGGVGGGGPGLGVGPGRPAGGYVPPALLAGCYQQEAAEALARLPRRDPPPPLQPGAPPAQVCVWWEGWVGGARSCGAEGCGMTSYERMPGPGSCE